MAGLPATGGPLQPQTAAEWEKAHPLTVADLEMALYSDGSPFNSASITKNLTVDERIKALHALMRATRLIQNAFPKRDVKVSTEQAHDFELIEHMMQATQLALVKRPTETKR